MTTTRHTLTRASFAAFAALLLAAVGPAAAQTSQGFFRTVEGYASLYQGGTDTVVAVEPNYPLIVGDRIQVSRSALIEAILPDGSYLRLAGDSELAFDRLAYSVDGAEDDTTLLRLLYGEFQLVLPVDALGDDAVRIDTVNATVYLGRQGSYRIASDGSGWSEVLVREGYAEVVTERGSAIVRAGESAAVRGERWPAVTLAAAGPRDALERWGDRLLAEASRPASRHVDPYLAYAAAPLDRYGSWVEINTGWAWRPRVEVGWRPYHTGWWTWSPAGMTWVSFEPWGWVTHHYGMWDWAPGFGWVWYPGRVYSPAAVYWYWGPSHVAWIPIGYYSSFYGPRYGRHGFHFGIYGWAGGHPSYWADWTFCPTDRFGYRHSRGYLATGADLTRRGQLREVPRGIIATDTRAVTRDLVRRPQEAVRALEEAKARSLGRSGGDFKQRVPDVTEFIARKPALSEAVAREVLPREDRSTRDLRSRTESPYVQGGKAVTRGGEPPTATRPEPRDKVEATRPSRPPASEAPAADWRDRKGEPSTREREAPRALPTRPGATKPGSDDDGKERWRKPEPTSAPVWRREDTSRREPVKDESWRGSTRSGSPVREPLDRSGVRVLPGAERGSSFSGKGNLPGQDRSAASWRERTASPPGLSTRSGSPAERGGSERIAPPVVHKVLEGVRSYRYRGGTDGGGLSRSAPPPRWGGTSRLPERSPPPSRGTLSAPPRQMSPPSRSVAPPSRSSSGIQRAPSYRPPSRPSASPPPSRSVRPASPQKPASPRGGSSSRGSGGSSRKPG